MGFSEFCEKGRERTLYFLAAPLHRIHAGSRLDCRDQVTVKKSWPVSCNPNFNFLPHVNIHPSCSPSDSAFSSTSEQVLDILLADLPRNRSWSYTEETLGCRHHINLVFPCRPRLYFLSNTLRTLTYSLHLLLCLYCSDTKMYFSHHEPCRHWHS